MTVKEVIDKTLNSTNIKVVDHWHSNLEYRLDFDIENRTVKALIVENNNLIISI